MLFHWHLPSVITQGQDNKNATLAQSCLFPLDRLLRAAAEGAVRVHYQFYKKAFYQASLYRSAFTQMPGAGVSCDTEGRDLRVDIQPNGCS